MNLRKKQIFLGILVLVSISIPFYSLKYLNLRNVERIEKSYYYDLRSSQWVLPSPIVINETDPAQNWASTAASEPWCSGSGIWSDPYIIQDVTIDLQGVGGIGSCISIYDSNVYFQIKDCTLIKSGWGSYGTAGIYMSNTNNGQLLGNNCSNHNYNGIYLYECDNNTISGNILKDNQNGIELDHSHYNTISGNAPNSNSVNGIDVGRSNNNTIISNVLSFNRFGINLATSENSSVTANTMSSCGIIVYFDDTFLDEFMSNKIDISNTVNGKPVYYTTNTNNLGNSNFPNPGQIILINCSDSIFSNFDIIYTSYGIQLLFCKNITLFNNDFNNNILGIAVRYSSYVNITDNLASNNEAGISVSSSKNCTISENEVNNNADIENMWGYGIYVASCENCTISDNTANNNYDEGLSVIHSEDILVDGNTLNYNRYGIWTDEIVDCEIRGNIINGVSFAFENWDVGIFLYPSWWDESVNNTLKDNIMTNCGLLCGDPKDFDHMTTQDIDTSNLVNGNPLYYYSNETGLTATNFTNAGQVFLINTNSSTIDNLIFSNTTVGIQLFSSHDNIISNCEFRYNKRDSFSLYKSNDNEIIGNTFENTNEGHLWIQESNGNHITDNTITDDPVHNPSIGISLGDCNYSFVLRNDVHNCWTGIMASGAHNSFSGNNLSNNVEDGLIISYSEYNTVINNTLNSNWDGMSVESSNNNNILNNTMNNNRGYGLILYESSNNIVSDNIFRCNRDGCWLDEGGTGNTFINNTCEECPDGNGNGDGPGGFPFYYLIIIFAIVGIIAVVTVVLLRRRRKS
ncbi:MAG: NosD domain-containing protein [Candidatus Hermodarchaeota archaeon]